MSTATVARAAGHARDELRRVVTRRRLVETSLVLAGSLALVIAITWPLVLHLGTDTPGSGVVGDRSGYTWDVWFNGEHGLRLWGSTTQHEIGAPFGRVLPASINTLQLVFLGPAWIVSRLGAGPLVAVNVSLLLGMVLGPATMFLLIRWLGLGIAASTWAAVAFAVFPNALVRATGHYPLAVLACFPILLLVLWRWMERPGWTRAIWLAVGVLACWLTNPYYGTMAFVVLGVGGTVAAVQIWRDAGIRAAAARTGEAAAAVAGLVLLPLAALFWSSHGAVGDTLTRSRIELALYGARITDYLVPDAGNESFRSLLGDARWSGLGAPGGERADFVGYVTLLLAAVGLVWAVRHRDELPRRVRLALVSAVPCVLVLVWFSLATPTRWLGVEVPTPSGVVFDVAPFLRVYARFAVAVTAVLICVAAIGLAAVVRGRRPVVVAGVAAIAVALSALELPPGGGLPLRSDPPLLLGGLPADRVPLWLWLRDVPPRDTVVWNFPAYPDESVERFHMYGQLVHGLTISNGDPQLVGIGTDMTSEDPDPRTPGVAERLSTLGVDYATVDARLFAAVGVPAPDPERPPGGFRLVRSFGDGSAVWKVTATPLDAMSIFQRSSWWPPEPVDGREWRFMRDTARMTVWAPRAGTYRVDFGIASFPARTLRIEDPAGGRHRVSAGAARDAVMTTTLAAGRSDFRLTNEGAAAVPAAPGDPRIVSLRVSEWSLTRVRAGR